MNSCFLVEWIKLSIFDEPAWSLRNDHSSQILFEGAKIFLDFSVWNSYQVLKLKIYFPVDIEQRKWWFVEVDAIENVNGVFQIFLFIFWGLLVFQSQFKHFSLERSIYILDNFLDVGIFDDENLLKIRDVKGIVGFVR